MGEVLLLTLRCERLSSVGVLLLVCERPSSAGVLLLKCERVFVSWRSPPKVRASVVSWRPHPEVRGFSRASKETTPAGSGRALKGEHAVYCPIRPQSYFR